MKALLVHLLLVLHLNRLLFLRVYLQSVQLFTRPTNRHLNRRRSPPGLPRTNHPRDHPIRHLRDLRVSRHHNPPLNRLAIHLPTLPHSPLYSLFCVPLRSLYHNRRLSHPDSLSQNLPQCQLHNLLVNPQENLA